MSSYSVARLLRTTTAPSTARCAHQFAVFVPITTSHQRRRSSSKASIPPNASPRSRSTPTNGQARRGRKPLLLGEDKFAHLPSVPPTEHLFPTDIHVASFFSLHRPISVLAAFPPKHSNVEFDSIFDRAAESKRNAKNGQVDSFGDFVRKVRRDEQAEESEEMAWSLPERHMYKKASVPDNVPRSQPTHFPFSPPPAPQAASPDSITAPRSRRARARASSRSWTTTIVVTEFTARSGSKKYAAASTPLIRLPSQQAPSFVAVESAKTLGQTAGTRKRIIEPSMPTLIPAQPVEIEEPIAPLPERPVSRVVYNRVERPREEMLAISVRRQRKIKMKKHKYKKLMRRTRNLRRKMGKI